MNSIVEFAITSVHKSKTAFCKFISANDAGKTGAHQEGFYIPKNSISLMFDEPAVRGQNKDRYITIKWQNDFKTNSRFIYYGKGTRNEYRLTRFGRNFPFLTENTVGDILILSHIEADYYEGFVLQSDEEIEEFFAAFNISPAETNCLINKSNITAAKEMLLQCFKRYLGSIKAEFPSSAEMAYNARKCYIASYHINDSLIKSNPDKHLLEWIDAEYQLFRIIENDRYKVRIKTHFNTVEELVNCANTILNRRKSRAGKSLELHLAEIFNKFTLKYDTQGITEESKKPDFIFPDLKSYHNKFFNTDKLVFLASKTTCKDRWRQILNEADRVKEKHLFTLQQGISINQLQEMHKYNVKLVVPEPYISSFPLRYREEILTLSRFINFVREKQS